MPCYHPLDAWVHPSKKTDSGAKLIRFSYKNSECNSLTPDFQVPCGRCIGCRLGKSREWAVRCMHEASLYWDNCWLTLTLNDAYLNSRPNPYSIQRGEGSEITNFLKRLRKQYGEGIRYYYCGEYGETCFYCNLNEKNCQCKVYLPWRGRPHYHMCIFNHDFDDKTLFKQINGLMHYNSPSLDALWSDPATGLNMGYSTISDLTVDSAGYTARYCLKKITGEQANQPDPATGLKYYQRLSPDGEIFDLIPEYTNMSRGSKKLNTGGVGRGWLDKYSKEVLDNDSVYFKNFSTKPPRFYDDKLYDIDPYTVEENKTIRLDKAKLSPDTTPYRLSVREYIAATKTKQLTRKEI